jgi:hypothetical protein
MGEASAQPGEEKPLVYLDMPGAESDGPPPLRRRPDNLLVRMLATLFVYQSLLPLTSHAEKVAVPMCEISA